MTNSSPIRRFASLQPQRTCLHSVLASNSMVAASSRSHSLWQMVQVFSRPLMLVALLGWQTSGHGRGLVAEEQDVATRLASQAPWGETAGKRQSHPLGVQTLFVEKQESKDASQGMRARVYQYDYTTQSARLLVIDLASQAVIREQGIESVHLPLSEQEIAFARNLVAADDTLLSELRSEQTLRNVTPFTSLDELDVKASIYEPLDSADPCFVSRCALLSLFDASSTVFSTEPLIDLSRQQVGELHRR